MKTHDAFKEWLKATIYKFSSARKGQQMDDSDMDCQVLRTVLKKYQEFTQDKIILVLDKKEYAKRLVSEADKTFLSYDDKIVKLGKLEDLIEQASEEKE